MFAPLADQSGLAKGVCMLCEQQLCVALYACGEVVKAETRDALAALLTGPATISAINTVLAPVYKRAFEVELRGRSVNAARCV